MKNCKDKYEMLVIKLMTAASSWLNAIRFLLSDNTRRLTLSSRKLKATQAGNHCRTGNCYSSHASTCLEEGTRLLILDRHISGGAHSETFQTNPKIKTILKMLNNGDGKTLVLSCRC